VHRDNKKGVVEKGGGEVIGGEDNGDMVEVYQVALTVASPSSKHINYVRFPYYYMEFTDNNKLVDLDLEHKTMHYIPKEDLEFFLDFIEKNDKSAEKTEDSVFTYCLRVSGYNGGSDLKVAYGYDTFPEELNEVIDRLNKLCKQDLLEHPTEMITDIPSFVYKETGISEDDYPREDVEKMFAEERWLGMDKMFSSSGGFVGMMNAYYGSITAANIEKYIPHEIKDAAKISDEDYTEAVNKFLAELGDGWEIQGNISTDGLTMIFKDGHPTHGYMYIGKAELVSKWQKSGDLQYDEFSEQYEYMMPAGGEGMTKRSDFIYNKEADLVLVDYNCAGLDYDEYVELFYNLREK
jgi:hypothetical protein